MPLEICGSTDYNEEDGDRELRLLKRRRMVEQKSNQFWNIPNVLTLLRLLLIPVVVLLAVRGQMIWGGIAFILVCMTDLLDGYIARKYHMITKVGIWLDPVADKLMAISVIITFTVLGVVPLWVTVTLFLKDGLLLVGGALALRNGNSTPSDIFGKVSAFLLNASIAAGFFREFLGQSYLYLLYIALGLVILAFIRYAIINWRLIFPNKSGEKEE